MSADHWLLTIGIIAPVLFALVAYAATAFLKNLISARIDPIDDIVQKIHISLSERNGGSSVRDQFVFIREDLAILSGQFSQHITEHGITPEKPKRLRKTS